MPSSISVPAKFLAGCLLAATLAAPVDAAAVKRKERSIAAEYVRARAAGADGHLEQAAAGYASVLAAMPDDEVLAARAYRQAVLAGDKALALKAARTLDARGVLPPDGWMLLLVDAVGASDWKRASQAADAIEKEGSFAFMVPVLRAWLAYGSRTGDPLALLADARKAGAIATVYASEHRALLLLAKGRYDEGVTAIQAFAANTGARTTRLRIAAAAEMAKRDKARALGMLDGDDPILVAARQQLKAGKLAAGAIDTAPEGIAQLLVRVAADMNRERPTPLSLSFARFATFLAPRSADGWIVTSDLLADAQQYNTALAALDQVRRDDPFALAVTSARVGLLVKQGQQDRALKDALAMAERPGAAAADWALVGGVYGDMKRYADAADAYGKAIALAEGGKGDGPLWTLLLLQGSVLDQGGDWPAAKAVLEKAAKLAPDQAQVLNYLGYAQLQRGENLAQAEKLIEEASRLRPDDAAITDSLGWTYYMRGNIPKAVDTLERAVAGEPAEPEINEHLGDAYWKAGRRVEARWAWRAALVYADDSAAARLRAKIQDGLGGAMRADGDKAAGEKSADAGLSRH